MSNPNLPVIPPDPDLAIPSDGVDLDADPELSTESADAQVDSADADRLAAGAPADDQE